MLRRLVILCVLALSAVAQTNVRTLPTNQTLTLQASVTKTADFTGTALPVPLSGRDLIVTLDVTAADAAGTYDFYITTTDGVSTWDIAHFTQIAGTAKRYTAIISGSVYPVNVTTAAPGVLAVTTSTLDTGTAGSGNGTKTLGAGLVRHGPWGNTISHILDAGGTVSTGVTYSITVTVK